MIKKISLLIALLIVSISQQAQTYQEIQKLLANNGSNSDHFGYSVSISGDYAIIGAYGDSYIGGESGSAYIFYNNSGNWEQLAKLIPSDGNPGNVFGISVSISDDFAIVGAPWHSYNGIGSGSAYIFYNNNGTWEEYAILVSSGAASGDQFGKSVSISGDYAIVGAFHDDDNGNESGSAYIFHNNLGNWEQQIKLIPPDGDSHDWFGKSSFIFNDYAIVGAYGDDDNGNESGSAYVYSNNSGTWELQNKVTASDGAEEDRFGYSVCMSSDYAIISAYQDDVNGERSGSAYIFYNNEGVWLEQTKLTPDDGEANDIFGISVFLSENLAIIGASNDDDNGENSGSTYLFKNDSGIWAQQSKLLPSNSNVQDYFGCSVCFSNNNILIGADGDGENGVWSGAAYIFGNPLPNIILQPTNQSNICVNSIVSFSIEAEIAENYLWQFSSDNGNSFTDLIEGGSYSGTQTSFLSVIVDYSIDNYQYRCLVSNEHGTVNSDVGNLIIDFEPPEIISIHEDQFIDANENCETSLPDYTNEVIAIDNCDSILEVMQSPIPGTIISGNSNTISITVTDNSENSTQVFFNVEVVDNIDPTIVCIDSQTIDLTQGQTFYMVQGTEFDPVSIDDNCEIASITNNLNDSLTLEGAELPIGTTTVVWTVFDGANNFATCGFSIIINPFVGIETLQQNEFYISPNPTNGKIHFDFDQTNIRQIIIFDLAGKTIIDKTKIQRKETIDLSSFDPGVYIISIQTDKEMIITKIVKN